MLDTLERGHRAAVDAAPLIVGSIEDGPLVEATIREHGIEAVIHFAALKSVEESFADPVALLHGQRRRLVRAAPGDGQDGRGPARLLVVVRGLRDALGPAGARDERAPAGERRTARRSCSSSAGCAGCARAACGRSACATSTPPGPPSMDATARTGRTRRTSCRSSSRRRSATVRRSGSSGPTTRHPTAAPSATTSTSPTWPTPTSGRSRRSADGLADAALNLGTGVGSSVREVIAAVGPGRGARGADDRGGATARRPGGDLGRRVAGRAGARMAGRTRSRGRSSTAPGAGTPATRKATGRPTRTGSAAAPVSAEPR